MELTSCVASGELLVLLEPIKPASQSFYEDSMGSTSSVYRSPPCSAGSRSSSVSVVYLCSPPCPPPYRASCILSYEARDTVGAQNMGAGLYTETVFIGYLFLEMHVLKKCTQDRLSSSCPEVCRRERCKHSTIHASVKSNTGASATFPGLKGQTLRCTQGGGGGGRGWGGGGTVVKDARSPGAEEAAASRGWRARGLVWGSTGWTGREGGALTLS